MGKYSYKGNIDAFAKYTEILNEKKVPFTTQEFGEMALIIKESGQVWRFGGEKGFMPGIHICKMVKKDALDFISNNKMPEAPERSKTVLYNAPAIHQNIGNKIKAIDIKKCYWNIAYQLGYISAKTYKTGCAFEGEKKPARLIALGGLKKQTLHKMFRNGELIGKPVSKSEPTFKLWNSIVKYAEGLMFDLKAMLGNDFCYYLTDCVFCTTPRAQQVIDFLTERGFENTIKTVTITKVDGNRLQWREEGMKPTDEDKWIYMNYKTRTEYEKLINEPIEELDAVY